MARPTFHDLFVHAGLEDPPPPPLTLERVKEAILDYAADWGKAPTKGTGDASEYFGFTLTWVAVDSRLKKGLGGLPGGSSLRKICVELELVQSPFNLTIDIVHNALRAYHTETGKYPVRDSGDASKWLGISISWSSLDQALTSGLHGLPGGTTLYQQAMDLGLAGHPLTIEYIQRCTDLFFSTKGTFPFDHSGDATDIFGFNISWGSVDYALRKGLRGLPGGNTLSEVARKTGVFEKIVVRAVVSFHEEKGRAPGASDGNASPWLGFKMSWSTLNSALMKKSYGIVEATSLHKLAVKLKLKEGTPDLEIAQIEKAVENYYSRTKKLSFKGDASEWFGFPITWEIIKENLAKGGRGLPGGDSILSVCARLNIVSQAPLTMDGIEKAIKKHIKETGKPPSNKYTDASLYFGFPITWGVVDYALRKGLRGLPGGSSLSALTISFTGRGIPLTPDLILKAAKRYEKDEGKLPGTNSGDASKYFGFPERWDTVNSALNNGCRGLPKGSSLLFLFRENGIAPKEKKANTEDIGKAILKYTKDKGYPPTSAHGDASRWLGFKATWGTVDQALTYGRWGLPGGSSLAKLKKEMGLS